MLAGFHVALGLERTIHSFVEYPHQLSASAKRIHGAALDKRLQNPFVQQPQINFLAEFTDGVIASIFFTSGGDRLYGVMADILHRRQTKANCAAVWREVGVPDVDVGWLDRNSHLTTFVDVLHHVI